VTGALAVGDSPEKHEQTFLPINRGADWYGGVSGGFSVRQEFDMVGKIIDESLINMTKVLNVAAAQSTKSLKKMAEVLRGLVPPMPEMGDYVRVTEELDGDYGLVAEVTHVTWNQNPTLRDVHITLNPLGGGGVKMRRTISPSSIRILNEMEVLAEASK
jgi:hypothetical protein